MSRIKPLDRQDVPELEPFLSVTEKRMGFLPNSQLILSRKPKILQAFRQLGQAVNDPSNKTSPQLRALVSHMASKSVGCQYCIAHTGAAAHNADVEDQKIATIAQFETSSLFNDAERDAIRFAQHAAAVPNTATDEDFARLRKHFGDEEIVELLAVVAYFGFLNRWNDTLATELESPPLNFAQCTLSGTGWSAGKHSPTELVASPAGNRNPPGRV
jgi:uncharacterized peroxidase-related enzyme